MLANEDFEFLVRSGGCIYGGAKGQGKALCRAAVADGSPWCPRHKMLVEGETRESQQAINLNAERAAIAIRHKSRGFTEREALLGKKVA